jgi:hypothetical protein
VREVTSSFTPKDIEASVQKFWPQEEIYAGYTNRTEMGKPVFVDGPRIQPVISTLEQPGIRSSKTVFSGLKG